jgi:hypothetical protein
MPGHIKKTEGPDPDPAHWLYVSYELKEKNKVRKRIKNQSGNTTLFR